MEASFPGRGGEHWGVGSLRFSWCFSKMVGESDVYFEKLELTWVAQGPFIPRL